jgi:putative hydrolase of the HAD superfamily
LPRVLHWRTTPLEALLLDLDDTILDGSAGLEDAWSAVANELAKALGDVEPAAVAAQMRTSSDWYWSDDERHRTGRLDMRGSRRAVLRHVCESFGRALPDVADEVAELYARLREASLAPFDGALDALARLREQAPALGLVTNGAADAQRAKIERFGLARFFDVIVVEGEVGFGKPDPRNFQHALAAVGAAPERALMAGDNYDCDVLGALGAGLHAAWIDRARRAAPPPGRPAPPRAHATLASFVELARELGVRDPA